MRKRIKDKFTNLKVSRQRKYQILHQRAGLCIKCPEKAVAGRYCQRHHDIERRQRRVRRATWVTRHAEAGE